MNARFEGLIKGGDTVGSEEEDAGVVFQDAQEDGDHGVAVEIMQGALLQEDVCFVNEEDGTPGLGAKELVYSARPKVGKEPLTYRGHVHDGRELFVQLLT